jgi:hypothetical protein
MKHQSLEAEAEFINRHFANHQLVNVHASILWDADCGDPENQVNVDIIAPRARATIEAERERESAMFAAVAELEALPFVESVDRGGWIDAEDGRGHFYLVTLNLAEWRVGSDGRLYRH